MRIGRLILRGWNFLANVFGTEALAGTKYSLRIVNFSLKVTKSIDVELDR